ncbi:MAG: DUF3459 domain-containing protein, partial [Dehalococcoidia bacterium]|nr:DUF3459 domain-containing protein [Dehalococcoidia bacterium]
EFYKELIRLRKESPALGQLNKEVMQVTGYETERVMTIRRWSEAQEVFIAFNFGDSQASPKLSIPRSHWHKQLDSSDAQWLGSGSLVPEQLDSEGEVTLPLNPEAFVLFSRGEII